MIGAAETLNWWDQWIHWTWVYQPLFTIIATLLWVATVWYTIKTFRQIKRQTDLQSEAFLVVSAQAVDAEKTFRGPLSLKASALHTKWRQILDVHLPNAVQPDKWLILKLTNRGRADIVNWTINVQALVSPGEYLAKTFNTLGEAEKWVVAYQSHADMVLQDGGGIDVAVARLGTFPNIELSWSISYVDARNISYTRFGGDGSFADTNALAITPPPVDEPGGEAALL